MRMTPTQLQTTQHQIHQYFGDAAALGIFGSCLGDAQKGGDVGIYVEAGPYRLLNAFHCKICLEEHLDIPVELSVRHFSDDSPVVAIAKKTGEMVKNEPKLRISKKLKHLHRSNGCLNCFYAKNKPLMTISSRDSLLPMKSKSWVAFTVQFIDRQNPFVKSMH